MMRLQGEQLQILAASTSGLRREVEDLKSGKGKEQQREEKEDHPAALGGQCGEDGERSASTAVDVGAMQAPKGAFGRFGGGVGGRGHGRGGGGSRDRYPGF